MNYLHWTDPAFNRNGGDEHTYTAPPLSEMYNWQPMNAAAMSNEECLVCLEMTLSPVCHDDETSLLAASSLNTSKSACSQQFWQHVNTEALKKKQKNKQAHLSRVLRMFHYKPSAPRSDKNTLFLRPQAWPYLHSIVQRNELKRETLLGEQALQYTRSGTQLSWRTKHHAHLGLQLKTML